MKENYIHYNNLPDEDYIADEYLKVADFLKLKEYSHYEVSSFAMPGKESAHNLTYWKYKTVAALGPSATGFFGEEGLRYKWKPNIPELEIEKLSEKEFRFEKIYMALRSEEGIRQSDFPSRIIKVVGEWKSRNLVTEKSGVVKLTSKGYLLLDSLMGDLFEFL